MKLIASIIIILVLSSCATHSKCDAYSKVPEKTKTIS
jgi:hypothetical protein